ncbi:MAG TPA: DUF1697 domain-containing protein [Bryobacteraceae bacterium]|nr:DUF1697 domain-containing protein [Bryobacteraceae bacterium]
MTAAVALIRAINVGGRNMIRMEALRAAHEGLGLVDVQTYVQSGNVVFRAQPAAVKNLGRRIEDAIEKGHGFRPGVVVRTAEELRGAIALNPFAGRKRIEPAKLLVIFLIAEPDPAAAEKLRAIQDVPEEFHLIGRDLYIYFPNGQGRSKFPPLAEKTLKTPGTGRNWNTVTKLLEMAEALEGQR